MIQDHRISPRGGHTEMNGLLMSTCFLRELNNNIAQNPKKKLTEIFSFLQFQDSRIRHSALQKTSLLAETLSNSSFLARDNYEPKRILILLAFVMRSFIRIASSETTWRGNFALSAKHVQCETAEPQRMEVSNAHGCQDSDRLKD